MLRYDVCSPVQVQLQVREDEFLLNELPDDSGHLISLHLHHRACLDLLRHLQSLAVDTGDTQTLKIKKREIGQRT